MGEMIFSAVVLLAGICLVRAYPSGPPSTTCSSLMPSHGSSGQTSAVPYQIDLTQFSDGNGGYAYTPGQTYTLTLSDPGESTFRGFFVQSRVVADGSRVGTFAVINSGSSQLSPCPRPADGIAHSNSARINFSNMTMSWTAPPAGTGPIQFAYTVVMFYSTFWADQRSATLEEAGAEVTTSTEPPVQPSPTMTPTPSLETASTTVLSATPSTTPGLQGSASVTPASLLLLLFVMGAMLLLF